MRLPKKDSATWRAIITGLESFVGFMVTMVALPEFRQLVTEWYPTALPLIVVGTSIAAFVLNYFRSSVDNY
jgi:hypothetical protein